MGGRVMYKVYEITKETCGDSGISNTDWSDFINSNSHQWKEYIRELWIEYKRLQCEICGGDGLYEERGEKRMCVECYGGRE